MSAYGFSRQFRRLTYSGISGSVPIFGSPEHFVVYHALLRLWVPRYPPQAFCRLNLVVECCATRTTCDAEILSTFIGNWSWIEVHRFSLPADQDSSIILPYWCVPFHRLGSQVGDKRTRTAGIRHRVSCRLSGLSK